mgnify:CR=1 FL=1
MKRKRITAILLSLCFFALTAWAQEEITVESMVDRDQILIGDVITYSVQVSYAPAVEVQMPSLAENLGMFEIREYEVIEPKKVDDRMETRTDYLISTFDTGEFEIPELEIMYRSQNDSAWQSIKTEPITIRVESLNPDEAGDIRDIKPPKTPPRDYRAYILWGLLALLVIAIAVFIWYYLKRRREGKPILPTRTKPPRPAHEVALEQLDALTETNLLADGEIKEYYTRLSEIIRQYIEHRYFIYATEMTTTQLLGTMRDEGIKEAHVDQLHTFLLRCDMVKFAKYLPSDEEHAETTHLAYEFVHDTKLVIVEEPEKETEMEGEETVEAAESEPVELDESDHTDVPKTDEEARRD